MYRKSAAIWIMAVGLALTGAGLTVREVAIRRTSTQSATIQLARTTGIQTAALTSALDTVAAGYPGIEVSVSLVEISTGTAYTYGQTAAFTAASTSKLLTAALVLRQVEGGYVRLDQQVGSPSVAWHLEQMIRMSNNDSWSALNDLVSGTALQTYAWQLGLTSYQFATNELSSTDAAKLLQQLATGELLSAENSARLLAFMQQTNNEDLIAAAVPSDVTVYHKYGWYAGNLHDAAILERDGRRFVLVIYTNSPEGVVAYTDRVALIHQLVAAALPNL